MPLDTRTEARDEILTLFKDAWDTLGSAPQVIYDDSPADLPDDASYVRITVQHTASSQVTLGGKVSLGGAGRRFRRTGIVAVQIFTPVGDGLTANDTLVDFTVDIFEGESTGSDRVEFLNVRSNELGADGPWFQTNVVAEFNYDRVK